MLKIISSLDNPAIKHVVKLHSSKGREQFGQCIVEGVRACETFIQARHQPLFYYTTQSMLPEAERIVKKTEITVVSDTVMRKISTATTPSGILAVFAIPQIPLPQTVKNGLVCANLQDPGNAGTLIRTAAAFAYQAVFMVDGVDAWNPKVIQASAGTIAHIPVYSLSWCELITFTRTAQLDLCALVVSGGKKPQEINFKNTVLVVGNEANGLPQEWQKECTKFMTLPMPGNTESLNAAIAGAIALYCGSLQN